MLLQRVALAALFSATLLAGCSSTTSEPAGNAEVASSDRCNAQPVQALIGKPVSRALVQEAKSTSGAKVARVMNPNDAMTMDYNSQRLNIDVDAQQVIRQISCG